MKLGEGSEEFASLADQLGIAHMLRVSGRLGYRESLAALARSHVALLLGGSVDFRSTPTKIYEYFYMKKPILAVLNPGHLWDLMERAAAEK